MASLSEMNHKVNGLRILIQFRFSCNKVVNAVPTPSTRSKYALSAICNVAIKTWRNNAPCHPQAMSVILQ